MTYPLNLCGVLLRWTLFGETPPPIFLIGLPSHRERALRVVGTHRFDDVDAPNRPRANQKPALAGASNGGSHLRRRRQLCVSDERSPR